MSSLADMLGPMPQTPRNAVHVVLVVIVAVVALLVLSFVTPLRALSDPAPDDQRPRFGWPLEPAPPVARNFDPPETGWGSGHRGVDLAAARAQPVLAADAGVVVFAGRLAGRGVVSIEHEGGLRTTYEPVRPTVTAGTRVHRGQVIGTVAAGHPECPLSACLHWGVRSGPDDYLDPLVLVRTDVTIRLKPWDGGSSRARPLIRSPVR